MKTKITKIERIIESTLQPGTYQGAWGGYEVRIGREWRLTTLDGVRGINIPCTVTITEDGSATVESNPIREPQ